MAQPVEIALGTNAADPNTVGAGAAIPVTQRASVGGGITWGAPQPIAMTGVSKPFIPANAARKAVMYWNPAANAPASYDLSGGVVTLAGGIPLIPGAAPTVLTGADCPVTAITAIGTNTQNLYYVEGT